MKGAHLSRERMYDIIHAPILTEKTNVGSELNQFTFRVPLDASKPEIKEAVEGLFGVRVKAVNTLIHKGKSKRFRGRNGKQSDVKKAIVTLAEGDTIDMTTGI
ncbi:MAG: large subunit ribosomal protein L23 [Rhodospirillaceae bacterium]|nr:MAG: large subunit ribosomal protein L23 [Rhodospirillaceae bacterium]